MRNVQKSLATHCLATLGVLLTFTGLAWGGVQTGDKPKITWATVNGQAVTNAELAGRIIIIDFWATWCGPCMAEADHMVKLSKEFADKGVAIVGVSLDQNVAQMRQVSAAKGFTWPQVCDGRGCRDIAAAWGVDGIPCTFILSPDGEVVWSGHPSQIDRHLEAAVKKYPTQPPMRLKATQALQAGIKSIGEKSYDKALTALKDIPADVKPDAPLTTLAKQFAEKLTTSPAGKEALAGSESAVTTLTNLGVPKAALAPRTGTAATPATPAPAGSPPAAAVVDARLAAADKDREANRDFDAYTKYKWIVEHAAGTPAAEKAAEHIANYEKDTSFQTKAKAQQREKDAASDLWLAKSLLTSSPDKARPKLEAIVKTYPGTAAAKEAQELLSK